MSGSNNSEQQEEKLEDILRSIKGIIDDREEINNSAINLEQNTQKNANSEIIDLEEDILDLCNLAESNFNKQEDYNKSASMISSKNKKKIAEGFEKFSDVVKKSKSENDNVDFLEDKITKIMNPLISGWLDKNLAQIVELVVRDEIKKIRKNL